MMVLLVIAWGDAGNTYFLARQWHRSWIAKGEFNVRTNSKEVFQNNIQEMAHERPHQCATGSSFISFRAMLSDLNPT